MRHTNLRSLGKIGFVAGLLALAPCGVVRADLAADLAVIRAVGPEGLGNRDAQAAWKGVAAVGAEKIPEILAGMDGAGLLAANWLAAAVDTIAARSDTLPLDDIRDFLADERHDPHARRLAWELIRDRAPEEAEELVVAMLDDPSVELRREAVSRELDAARGLETAGPQAEAVARFRRALGAARDVDQIEAATKALEAAGETVDLPQLFGFLMHWNVVGVFDNKDGAGFAAIYPPEEPHPLVVGGTYAGRDGTVSWRPFVTADRYGMVDINKAYPGPDDGLKEVVAYAFTTFDAPEARDAEIRLGCKNAWKIWLNGALVFGREEYHRGMQIDQYRLPVTLREGPNTILIKLCQDEQKQEWTKEWQFQMRICDATGTAIHAVGRPATPTAEEAAATAAPPAAPANEEAGR